MARYTIQSTHEGITYTVGTDHLEDVMRLVRARLEDGHKDVRITVREKK
jgi:hypothetical protein